MSETEDLARQALAEMDSINAMLKILVNPKKYKDLYDALTNHLAEVVRHHEQISEERMTAQSALADASKLASENESRSAEHNETTEKLASWETDLKQREGALKQGNAELQRNLSERETELKRREDVVLKREKTVAEEEKRIEDVRLETVARLSK